MAIIAQSSIIQIDAYQSASGPNWADVVVTASRKSGNFWGMQQGLRLAVHGEYSNWWACPNLGAWKHDSAGYYIMYNGYRQSLSWYYWAPQAGYQTGTSIAMTKRVYIDRGNSKQGSTTINVGMDGTYSSAKCSGTITLYTTAVAEPSNLSISATADGKNVTNRYIRVSYNFTNPENFYSAEIYHNNVRISNLTIPITYAMFNTTQTFKLIVRGKDGSTKEATTSVWIEPSGVGIWYKQSGTAKEVFHVYYKNSQGNIIEVSEAWYRRNTTNIKTVK